MEPARILNHLLGVANEEYLRVSSKQILHEDPSDEDGSFLMGQHDALIFLRASLTRVKDQRPEPAYPLSLLEHNWTLWLRTYQGQTGAYSKGILEVVTRYLGYLTELNGGS